MNNLQERDGIKYSLRSIDAWFLLNFVSMILNELDIFHVPKNIFRASTIIFVVILGINHYIVKKFPDSPNLKYFLATTTVLLSFISILLLNVHVILLSVFPIAIASYYSDKKVNLYILLLTIVTIPLAIYLSIKFNTFEINFYEYLVYLLDPETIDNSKFITYINNEILALIIFYCLPNMGIAVIYGLLVSNVSKEKRKSQAKQLLLEIQNKRMDEIMDQYMEPSIVDEILNNDNKMEIQNKEITIMFVDIEGFTSLSENEDSKLMLSLLNSFLEMVSRCVRENNGIIDKFIGDCVMAIWNNESTDNASLACKAALMIKEATKELNKQNNTNLKINIGINCGIASIGSIGSNFRFDYTVVGDTVNVASRLQDLANNGDIYVTEEIVNKASKSFIFTNRQETVLRGRKNKTIYYSLKNEEIKDLPNKI